MINDFLIQCVTCQTRVTTRFIWKQNGEFYPLKHRCQFSWYCDGKADVVSFDDEKLYEKIRMFSEMILTDGVFIKILQ